MAEVQSVLLVDDDDDLRMIGRMALANVGGFEVHCASNGAEALTLAVERSPDVIVLDVMMPGMDGPTVFNRLRETAQTREIPVIFMTAKLREHDLAAYRGLGATGIIPKPFDPMTLADRVRELVAGL